MKRPGLKAEGLPVKLLEYGEKFMRMFDDAGSGDEAEVDALGEYEEGEDAEVSGSSEAEGSHDEAEETEGAAGGETPVKEKAVVFLDSSSAPKSTLSKKERRLFMSPRAADVHKVSLSPSMKRTMEEDLIGSAMFASISREVENLGASHMNEKDQKKWEAKKFTELGAKPAKSPKCSPVLGLAIRKASKSREEQQRQEDVAAGMILVKGSGKAKQKEKSRKRSADDRGLQMSEGKFKNGVLYVEPMAKKQKTGSGSGGNPHKLDLGFGSQSRRSGSSTVKKKKKGKAGKKGKGRQKRR